MAVKKIAPIERKYPGDFKSVESSLAQHGFYRNPGAYKTLLPYKGINNNYLTGLDENAMYLQNMHPEAREAEILRIKEDRARLEEATGLDLSPKSQFYNYAANLPDDRKVSPVKLGNKVVPFNTINPMEEIAWNWIKVHPNIAPSLQALENGDVNPTVCQYYVADDEIETKQIYSKKVTLNKAIAANTALTPTKRAQIARLMGLPATASTHEETVYNMIDTVLKDGEFQSGVNKGINPITLFNSLLQLEPGRLKVKDMVDQAIAMGIYREKGNDRIFEGENEVATSKTELVEYLLKEKANNQEDLLALEKKLNIQKIEAA